MCKGGGHAAAWPLSPVSQVHPRTCPDELHGMPGDRCPAPVARLADGQGDALRHPSAPSDGLSRSVHREEVPKVPRLPGEGSRCLVQTLSAERPSRTFLGSSLRERAVIAVHPGRHGAAAGRVREWRQPGRRSRGRRGRGVTPAARDCGGCTAGCVGSAGCAPATACDLRSCRVAPFLGRGSLRARARRAPENRPVQPPHGAVAGRSRPGGSRPTRKGGRGICGALRDSVGGPAEPPVRDFTDADTRASVRSVRTRQSLRAVLT